MLENEFDENFGDGLKIIAEYRRELKKILPDTESRIKFWRETLTPEIWQLLKSGKLDELKEILNRRKIYAVDEGSTSGD